MPAIESIMALLNQVLPVRRCVAATCVSMVLGAACVHVPPRTVIRDRFDYGQSVAESWKQQMLLNIVRLRYADAPIFIDVTSVINSYTMAASANAGTTLYSTRDPHEFMLGANAMFSNSPTVTYQPLTGERFMKSMLQPIPPASVFQMLQAGWQADLILRTAVRSINGLANQQLGRPATERFDRLVAAITRLQQASALYIRVEPQKEGEAVLFTLPPQNLTAEASADAAEVRTLLGVEAGAGEYSIVFGLAPRSPTEIAVLTRSMIEVIIEYGYGIDVPATDVAEGRARPSLAGPVDTPAGLIHISTGASAPGDAYAAVAYRGRWFWVDDRDLVSKVRLTFLMILSSLAETGQAPAAPLLTLPSR